MEMQFIFYHKQVKMQLIITESFLFQVFYGFDYRMGTKADSLPAGYFRIQEYVQ